MNMVPINVTLLPFMESRENIKTSVSQSQWDAVVVRIALAEDSMVYHRTQVDRIDPCFNGKTLLRQIDVRYLNVLRLKCRCIHYYCLTTDHTITRESWRSGTKQCARCVTTDVIGIAIEWIQSGNHRRLIGRFLVRCKLLRHRPMQWDWWRSLDFESRLDVNVLNVVTHTLYIRFENNQEQYRWDDNRRADQNH